MTCTDRRDGGGPARRRRAGGWHRRPQRPLALLAAVATVGATAVACTGIGSHRDPPATPATAPTSTPAPTGSTTPTYTVREGPSVPGHGAYFGAWVVPEPFSQPGRVASVERFEASMGRTLAIVHLYRTWTQRFGTPSDLEFARRGSYLLLSWAGVDTRRTASGAEDEVIREHARELRQVPTKVFIEWRWEMDRPNLADVVHSPRDYLRAWSRIRSIFAQEGATGVGWVWCPTAYGFLTGRAQAYYPGDAQVDWLCADVYPEKPWVPGNYEQFGPLAEPFLDWAATKPKPVMIGEYGVPRTYGSLRAAWLTAVAAVVRAHPQIKAMIYFAEDPKRKPVFNHVGLTGDPAAAAALRRMARDPWFNPRRPAG